MEDHQRIDFCRQGQLLPVGWQHATPVVNALHEFGECHIHPAILPALGSEAEPQLIRNGDDEAWTQVTDES